MSVTDDQIKQFREDGAILLKNIFRSQVSKWKIVVIIYLQCKVFKLCVSCFFLTERTFWHWVSGVKSALGGHGEEWHWGRCVSLSGDKNCKSINIIYCYSCEEKFSESKSILWKTRTERRSGEWSKFLTWHITIMWTVKKCQLGILLPKVLPISAIGVVIYSQLR